MKFFVSIICVAVVVSLVFVAVGCTFAGAFSGVLIGYFLYQGALGMGSERERARVGGVIFLLIAFLAFLSPVVGVWVMIVELLFVSFQRAERKG